MVARKTVVKLLPRSKTPPNLFVEETISQFFNVIARNDSIHKLRVKTKLDGEGPFYFSWARPHTALDLATRRATIIASPTHIDLVRDEEVLLGIWMASRSAGQDPWVALNTDPVISRKLLDFKVPYIDLDIQFIAENYTDEKLHLYRLITRSWDEPTLTERD